MEHFILLLDGNRLITSWCCWTTSQHEIRVFSYVRVPQRIHTGQGAQFESRLMAELYAFWGVHTMHTTPTAPRQTEW